MCIDIFLISVQDVGHSVDVFAFTSKKKSSALNYLQTFSIHLWSEVVLHVALAPVGRFLGTVLEKRVVSLNIIPTADHLSSY